MSGALQLVAKAFPGRGSITQVIKTARSYWRQHPDKYIAIHCAYGEGTLNLPAFLTSCPEANPRLTHHAGNMPPVWLLILWTAS